MPSLSRKRRLLVPFLCLIAAAASTGLYLRHEYRRAQLNKQLIAAIDSGNDSQALALLRGGADGTASKREDGDESASGIWTWIKAMLHRQGPRTPPRKSALLCYYTRQTVPPRDDKDQELPLRLLDVGFPSGKSSGDTAFALCKACEAAHDKVVDRMLLLGANPNARKPHQIIVFVGFYSTDSRDASEFTHPTNLDRAQCDLPILVATAPCTASLLRSGADINVTDRMGNSALINACAFGDGDKAAVLLAHHANIGVRNQSGETALPNAAHACKLELVQALVRAGSGVNEASNSGVTSLMVAVDNPDRRVLPWLIAHGANVNATTKTGLSPLLIACECAELEVVKTLIHSGANPRQRDTAGETVEMYASGRWNEDILPWLLTQHPDLRARTHKCANSLKAPVMRLTLAQHRPGETLLDYLVDERGGARTQYSQHNAVEDRLIKRVKSLMLQTHH